jgi:Arm DNA-binding domain
MPKIINQTFVEALTANGRNQIVCDSQETGFAVRVTPTGTKIYVAQKRIGGALRRLTLGHHPEMSAAAAREEAAAVIAELRDMNQTAKVVSRTGKVLRVMSGLLDQSQAGLRAMLNAKRTGTVAPIKSPADHSTTTTSK